MPIEKYVLAMARELLTSVEGLMHRGKRLVNAEFAAIAVTHNIRKMIAKGYCVCSEVAVG